MENNVSPTPAEAASTDTQPVLSSEQFSPGTWYTKHCIYCSGEYRRKNPGGKPGACNKKECRRLQNLGNEQRRPGRTKARRQAQATAWKRGWEWDLTTEQYEAARYPGFCFYCSGAIAESAGGLDRRDSTRGYHPDNIVACCWGCNRQKSNMPESVFRAWHTHDAFAEADGSPGGEA